MIQGGHMMKVKKTSFKVTQSALEFENLLLEHMDIPRTAFHRKMIDYFVKNEIEIHPYLLIGSSADPHYVRKTAVEQIYLDEVREKKVLDIAERYGCRIGTVLFQAMMSYSIHIAPDVLGEKNLTRLFCL